MHPLFSACTLYVYAVDVAAVRLLPSRMSPEHTAVTINAATASKQRSIRPPTPSECISGLGWSEREHKVVVLRPIVESVVITSNATVVDQATKAHVRVRHCKLLMEQTNRTSFAGWRPSGIQNRRSSYRWICWWYKSVIFSSTKLVPVDGLHGWHQMKLYSTQTRRQTIDGLRVCSALPSTATASIRLRERSNNCCWVSAAAAEATGPGSGLAAVTSHTCAHSSSPGGRAHCLLVVRPAIHVTYIHPLQRCSTSTVQLQTWMLPLYS